MDNEKFNDLIDVVRRLKSAKAPENQIRDVIDSMTKGDTLTEQQISMLNYEFRKKPIPKDVSATYTPNFLETDYF